MNSGTASLSGAIAGGIVNMASGTVNIPQSSTIKTSTFTNYGTLDLTSGGKVGTTATIAGDYLGVAGSTIAGDFSTTGKGQGNVLAIAGGASGTSQYRATQVASGLTLFSGLIPIVTIAGADTATVSAAGGGKILGSFGSLITYEVVPDPANPNHQLDLQVKVSGVATGGIAGGVASAISSAATGFFQGSTAFLGAPAGATPNQIDGGVWVRSAAGMNDEHSTASVPGGVTNTFSLQTISHFAGVQVGSDLGVFNIQNGGWNLHAGITGGEYDAFSSESNYQDTSSEFHVPFLGGYAAVTGHNFFADVLIRHDFWQGSVSSQIGGIADAPMNGRGNAVTAETGYTFSFENGMYATPSAGFSYTQANFNSLTLLPGASGTSTNLFNVGPVKSELGRLGLTVGDRFMLGDWSFSPGASVSVWHEFAGQIPSLFTNITTGEPVYTQSISTSRVGTFGQFGLQLSAQPVAMPNLSLYVRGDYRTGSNIYGGTFTGGLRYTF